MLCFICSWMSQMGEVRHGDRQEGALWDAYTVTSCLWMVHPGRAQSAGSTECARWLRRSVLPDMRSAKVCCPLAVSNEHPPLPHSLPTFHQSQKFSFPSQFSLGENIAEHCPLPCVCWCYLPWQQNVTQTDVSDKKSTKRQLHSKGSLPYLLNYTYTSAWKTPATQSFVIRRRTYCRKKSPVSLTLCDNILQQCICVTK